MADQYRMSAVILCGGKSRRMGTDKAMLTAEGKPNAVRLLHALSGEDSPCTEVWLSIGTGESYPAIHAQKVSDRFPGCGPMGGLEAALTVCREEYLFVAPVDTPFADAQMARELMTYMADASRQRDAVLVVDGDGRLQTLLGIYHKRVLPSLTQRLADGRKEKLRMRDFLRELDVVYVNAQELTDGVRKSTSCNTPREWRRLMEQESARSGKEQVIVSVTGWSGSGKTTWLEKLLPELSMRGIRTAVVKHDAHDFEVDREGKDTWRMAQAGAAVTGIVSGYKAALMEYRPVALERFIGKIENVDLVILEGGSELDLPHILVYREALGKGMRVSPDSCLAVISDDPVGDGCAAVFSFGQIKEAADFVEKYLVSQRSSSLCGPGTAAESKRGKSEE